MWYIFLLIDTRDTKQAAITLNYFSLLNLNKEKNNMSVIKKKENKDYLFCKYVLKPFFESLSVFEKIFNLQNDRHFIKLNI